MPDDGPAAIASNVPPDPGELKIRDVTYGQLIRDLAGHPKTVMSARCSHDGRCIASASEDGSVRLLGPVP